MHCELFEIKSFPAKAVIKFFMNNSLSFLRDYSFKILLLQKFFPGSNMIDDEGVKQIFEVLKTNSTLTDLNMCLLFLSFFSVSQMKNIPVRVFLLALDHIKPKEETFRFIYESLKKNCTLTDLCIGKNFY